MDGASRIPDLLARTKELGMESIAITDHGNMYGVIDFYKEAKKQGIHPVIGCEVYQAPGSRFEKQEKDGVRYYHLILLAENNEGYKNLVKLVSLANIEGFHYKPRIDKELLKKYHEGIICLSACIAGEIPQLLLQDNLQRAREAVAEYVAIFGKDNYFLEIQDHGLPEERKSNAGLVQLAKEFGIGLVATNDLHYVRREDSEYHDILLCIQMGKTIDDETRMKFPNDEFYLKSPAEMQELFELYPEALANSVKIAERCQVDFEFGHLHLPNFPLPEGMTDEMYLRKLCEENLSSHYPEVTAEVKDRLEYELGIIHKMGYDSYFLIVWDFINHAREENIAVGPGRGSAAGSIVAYILGITNIDPLKYNLLFERFLNPERVTMPDIDVDFCYERREEVIEYVKKRYGSDHVAQIITFGTLAARGAIRDVGRVFNMPYNDVDKVVKLVPAEPGMTIEKALKSSAELRNLYEGQPEVKRLLDFAHDVEGFPRQSSKHAAGVVIARNPLTDYVPVQFTDGTLVTQFDKNHVEELGLLKMDFLGLRTLTVITDAIKNIKLSRGEEVDINKIPLTDEKTAAMLCRGDTGAVFQMESAGMTNLVKDLQPENFADLIPLVALYRPGPLGSGMVSDFINGRHGRKKVVYMHPLLEPILKETFGVVLYQEQVMQVVQVLAGFTLGQADILRRAMGKKKHEILMAQKENFLAGAKKTGLDDALAAKIFDLLTHFADYGFNKSHSAAYALVAWQTAYLKAHYPQEFMAAMLTSVKDDSVKVSIYIERCRQMGIAVLPPDINASAAEFSVDGEAIRFGLAAVRNVGENAIAEIVGVRSKDGNFKSLFDFCSRVAMKTVNKRVIESLIKCGAFDSLGAKRAQLLAVLEATAEAASSQQKDLASGQIGLFGEAEMETLTEVPLPNIPEVPMQVCLAWEKENTGFYITGHPLDEYREIVENEIPIQRIVGNEFKDGQLVRLCGLIVSAKRITTKKGDTMCFAEVEDYTHRVEMIAFPRVFYQYVNELVPETAVVVQGRVNLTDTGAKVIADKIWRLAEYEPEYYLFLSAEQETGEFMSRLQEILHRHAGKHLVYFRSKEKKKSVRANQDLWVDGSAELDAELRELLGSENLKKR